MPFLFADKVKKTLSRSKNLIRTELIFALLFSEYFAFLFNELTDLTFSYSSIHLYSLVIFLIFLASFLSEIILDNIRLVSNVIYVFGILFVVNVASLNQFNKDSFYAFVLVFCFFNFMLSSKRVFWILNGLVYTALFFLLFKNDFQTIVPLKLILSTALIISGAGFSLTSARNYYQNKIKNRENLLNHIFDSSYLGLILVDAKTNAIWDINERALSLFEYEEKEDIRGLNIEEIEVSGEEILKGNVGKKTFTHELRDQRIWRVNQQVISYQTRKFNLFLLDEFEDLLDFKEATDFSKIQSYSDASYQYLFEENVSLMCIIDEKDNIIDVNQSLCKLLSYEKKELIGLNPSAITHKEAENRDQLNDTARSGKEVRFEKSVLNKQGKKIELEVILRSGVYFGKEVLISNARDISQRIQLENEAKNNYERYYKVTNESAIGFVISDLDGKIIETNKSFLNFIGLSIEELNQVDMVDISHSEDYEKSLKIGERLLAGEIELGEMEKRYFHKDGSLLVALINVSLHRNSKGEGQYFFSQVVDITAIRQAQAELQISEKSYRDLFNHSDDLLYIINKENKFIDVNEAVLNHYGYKKSEVLGKGPSIFAAPGQNKLDDLVKGLSEVWNGRDLHTLWWSVKKSGEVFPKDLNIRKGYYFGEEVIIAKGKDISESYDFEKKLKAKEKRYRDLFERNLAGVYRTSLEGEILECNPAFLNILGYNEEDPEARNINANDFHINKEARKKFLEKLNHQDHLKGEKLELKKRNGENITVLVNVSVIHDEEGVFKFFEGSIIDISTLEKTQEKLKNSEHKFKELINSSSFGVMIIQNEQLVFANSKSALILEYEDSKELIGKAIEDIFLQEDIGIIHENTKDIKKQKQVPFSNFTVRSKKGNLVNIEAKPSWIEYEGETSLQISFIDISDKLKIREASNKIEETKKFNRLLQQQLHEKEVLLQEVHHRVKNNMQVISSILNLQGNYHRDEQVNKILKESQNRILSMALIHEKLYTTKDFSKISFSSYLEDLAINIIGSNKPKSLDLDLDFHLEKVFLNLDYAIPLGLIVNELVSNALKYAFRGRETGKLSIYLKENNETISLELKDDGPGLPPGLDFRETESLGLQLVNTLVGQLNGEITRKEEEGASFSIKFNRFE